MVEPACCKKKKKKGLVFSTILLEVLKERKLTVIPELILINHSALALVRNIGHPDAADLEPLMFGPLVQVFPEGFVQFLSVLCQSPLINQDMTFDANQPWESHSHARR